MRSTRQSSAAHTPLTIIYDARCTFCIRGSARLVALAAPGRVERIASADPMLALRFPQVSPAMVNAAMQMVLSDGTICSGAHAIARALATRPAWRLVTWLYFVPGLRWLIDQVYRLVAANRYRISGMMGRAENCASGVCATGTGESGACGLRSASPAGHGAQPDLPSPRSDG